MLEALLLAMQEAERRIMAMFDDAEAALNEALDEANDTRGAVN